MIDLTLPLCGPAADLMPILEAIPARHAQLAGLLWGEPGCGKSHLLDLFANKLTGSSFSIEQLNGQDLSVDVVRRWRERGCYGNLFSSWTVKRVDEIDRASDAAQAALVTFLDYLPKGYAVLATTNYYDAFRRADKGRLQRRFMQWEVKGPSPDEAAAYLQKQFSLGPKAARKIVAGAQASADLFSPVNMGAAVEDAKALTAARDALKLAA